MKPWFDSHFDCLYRKISLHYPQKIVRIQVESLSLYHTNESNTKISKFNLIIFFWYMNTKNLTHSARWNPLVGLTIFFDKKPNRKTLSFSFFLGSSLDIMFFLLCLSYFLNHLLHSEIRARTSTITASKSIVLVLDDRYLILIFKV